MMLQALIGSAGGAIHQGFSASLAFTGASSGTYTAQATFQTDGTSTYVHGSGSGNWFDPTTSGIGPSWSVKVVVSSGFGYTLGGSLSDGAWHTISSLQNITVANSNTNAESTGSFTVSFSSDGGSTTAATGSISWDCGKVS